MASQEKHNRPLVVSRDLLQELASELENEWRDLGRKLGISDANLYEIEANNKGDVKEAKYKMLICWKKAQGQQASYNSLAEALKGVRRTDLSEKVQQEEDKAGKRSVENAHAASSLERQPIADERPVKSYKAAVGYGSADLKGKYSVLVEALKREYAKRYSGVKPIPFLHDTWHCVNDIFVESKIKVLDNAKSKEDPTRWTFIKSRHEIFTQPSFGNIITIEGEPGFGKSTLLLQYAYDWCTSSTESPLKDIDIFILLRLKEVKDAPTIFDAIRMLLPDDLPLTSQDINAIITSGCWKVRVGLDGYDEYSGMEGRVTDVNRIIQGRILTACIIVITTRPSCLPKLQSPNARHFKLTGFDQAMQEEYIDKAIHSKTANNIVKELIMKKLQENVILSDICQVPFFFATFAHMNSVDTENEKLNSVTSYFSFMLACFFSHLGNKETAEKRVWVDQSSKEDPNQRLTIAKLAFDGLTDKEQKLLWRQSDLLRHLGLSCYNRYIDAGILLEEQRRTFEAIPGSNADNQIVVTTNVRFFHKTFQEFYAAYHIAHLSDNQGAVNVKEALPKLDLYDLQYVLRFACGLRPAAARLVQDYLSTLGEKGMMFSVLCLLEQQEGDVDQRVAEICSDIIMFHPHDSKLLRRSKIQLLHTASQRNISISCVWLRNCYSTVYLSGGYHLPLKSNLYIPVLTTLNDLTIVESGREISVAEFTDILQYSSKCLALKKLSLIYCLLPQSVQAESVSILKSRNVKVMWRVPGSWYQLNLQSCLWECLDGTVLTDEDYQSEVRSRGTWIRN